MGRALGRASKKVRRREEEPLHEGGGMDYIDITALKPISFRDAVMNTNPTNNSLERPLRDHVLDGLILPTHLKVVDLVNPNGCWNWTILQNYFTKEVLECIVGCPHPYVELGVNGCLWKLNGNGKFSIKTAYNSLVVINDMSVNEDWSVNNTIEELIRSLETFASTIRDADANKDRLRPGWVKINTDGASNRDDNRSAAIGVI
ncbi:hypothetical protein Gogos_016590 [Gossypium gossypioides]|uniref:RNase H type-1 domain-containing protein n=1 Tax=Gossypium gossypioides TaxID=34282 RepID=A0A7J9B889_GOSGO|nr:hypothetical protein [Gossypium gossypioides]